MKCGKSWVFLVFCVFLFFCLFCLSSCLFVFCCCFCFVLVGFFLTMKLRHSGHFVLGWWQFFSTLQFFFKQDLLHKETLFLEMPVLLISRNRRTQAAMKMRRIYTWRSRREGIFEMLRPLRKQIREEAEIPASQSLVYACVGRVVGRRGFWHFPRVIKDLEFLFQESSSRIGPLEVNRQLYSMGAGTLIIAANYEAISVKVAWLLCLLEFLFGKRTHHQPIFGFRPNFWC